MRDKKYPKSASADGFRRNSLRACSASLKQPPEIRFFILTTRDACARGVMALRFFNDAFTVDVVSVIAPEQTIKQLTNETSGPPSEGRLE